MVITQLVNEMNTLRDISGERPATALTKTDSDTSKLGEGLCSRCS